MEPPPTAKVLLHTSKGPVEIELWAKECPLACRNFIQLCLIGYYDNCLFHRVVPNFVVQSGDPTGTGSGGRSIYTDHGGVFADEFHSRLKFNRRGLVACANLGTKDTNGSQFVITLDATPELTGKNTLFGRVVGETVFNVLTIGASELKEGTEVPLYPAKITSTEILIPYFEDLDKGRASPALGSKSTAKGQKGQKTKKAVVRMNYDEDEDDEPTPVKKKVKLHERIKANEVKKGAATARVPESNQGSELHQSDEDGNSNQNAQNTLSHQDGNAAENDLSYGAKEQSGVNTTKKSQSTPSANYKNLSKQDREAQTLELLKSFRTKLSSEAKKETRTDKSAATGPDLTAGPDSDASDYENLSDDDGAGFLSHEFRSIEPQLPDQDLLVTIDPLEQRSNRNDRFSKLSADSTRRREVHSNERERKAQAMSRKQADTTR